jgi:hypothetical protein
MTASRKYEIKEAFSFLWKWALALLVMLMLPTGVFIVLPASVTAMAVLGLVVLALALTVGATTLFSPAVLFALGFAILVVVGLALTLTAASVALLPPIAVALLCIISVALLRWIVWATTSLAKAARREVIDESRLLLAELQATASVVTHWMSEAYMWAHEHLTEVRDAVQDWIDRSSRGSGSGGLVTG